MSLTALLALGVGGGWQLAWWHDAAVAAEPPAYASVPQVRVLALPTGPTVAHADRMPEETVVVAPIALDHDSGLEETNEVAHLMLSELPEPDIEALPSLPIAWPDLDLAMSVVLDARDRSVPPSLAIVASAPAPPAAERLASAERQFASFTRTYVVAPGDTLGSVAARFGINVETVRVANNLGDSSLLLAGQPLLVPAVVPAQPVSTTSVPAQPTARPAPTAAPVATAPPSTRNAAPTPAPTARPTAPPAPTSPPTTTTTAARTAPGALPGGPLVWPVNGIISQRFREGGHSGLDIAAPMGTTVKAAAPGTVVVAAKLNYGYGWRIIVDHGSYRTLYAHLSAFSVAEGARVGRGQVIGAVGSTGVSTGPHLHLEVLLNGQPADPQKYLP